MDTIITDTIGINALDISTIHPNQNIRPEQIINSQNQFLDKTLQSHSGIFIKTYGAGSISTISLRGGSSSQTMIAWNGIPINNPMLGLNDLSLIPMQAFQNIEITSGGHTAKYGNGAMTGVVNISNQHNLLQKFKASINTNYGSFNNKSLGGQVEINHKKLSLQANYHNSISENNFPYKLTSGDTKRQTHANFESETATLSSYYFINYYSSVKFNYWHQNTFRQIPPTTVQTRSLSDLHDIINRYNFTYNYNNSNLNIKSQLAFLDEQNNFKDSINQIYTNNIFKSLIHKTDAQYSINNSLKIEWGYNLNRIIAQTAFYENDQVILNLGGYASLNYRTKRSSFNITARQESHSEVNLPFAPSFSYKLKLDKIRTISFKVSKEFRAPTSNELFWRPGGNINLKPEIGWNQEITFIQNKKKHKLTASLFHRTIDNWILWSLNDLQFFQSTNIAKVRSYGLDLSNTLNFQTTHFKHQLTSNYAYIIAENLKTISSPNIKKGSQLFYKPIHKITIDYTLGIKDIFVNLNGQYISSTLGTLDEISGYELLNLNLKKTFIINQYSLDFSFSLNNLLNKQYRVIERRPMPGRHFDIGLKLNLTK